MAVVIVGFVRSRFAFKESVGVLQESSIKFCYQNTKTCGISALPAGASSCLFGDLHLKDSDPVFNVRINCEKNYQRVDQGYGYLAIRSPVLGSPS